MLVGMSQPLHDNATPSSSSRISSKMEFARPSDEADPDRASKSNTVTAMRAGSQQKTKKQSLDYILRTGLAGGIAGCAAKTVVGPLDRVKILFQASNPQFAKYTGSWFGVVTAMRDINAQAGMRGLFRGHSATLLRIFPYAAIKFLTYEQFRAALIPSPAHETPLRRLLSGSLAGITSVFITYPLEVIRVRLAFETRLEKHASLSAICSQIYHERPSVPQSPSIFRHPSSVPQTAAASSSSSSTTAPSSSPVPSHPKPSTPRIGLANFYRGFTPTLAGMLPYAGMSFLTHDTAIDFLRHPLLAPYTIAHPPSPSPSPSTSTSTSSASPPRLKSWAELLAGGIAGLVSQTASYPLEVIRRRMQVGGAVGDGHRLRMAETARLVWAERGFRGFWVGLGIGYFKVVPMSAVSFLVYERGKRLLGV